jgi:hypothetical protein
MESTLCILGHSLSLVKIDMANHHVSHYNITMVYTYTKNANGDFLCTICGETKKNQNTMHYHMKKHEGKLPFECSICHKEFLHSSVLSLHMTARHSKEPPGTLSCPVCPFKTLTKANRILHFVRHHCTEEIQKFTSTSSTQNHCPTCSKECNSSTAFLYHVVSAGCFKPDSAEKAQQLATIL